MNCQTTYCRNTKAPKGNYCHKFVKRRYRENNPFKASFQALKDNAKRRGKEFSLTFEQFKEFCIATDYINKRGVSATGLHIDRIDENGSYSIDNIQVLTNSDNVKKYLRYDYETKQARYEVAKEINTDGVPF